MSKFINKAHAAMSLIGALAIQPNIGAQEVKMNLPTNVSYDRFVMRAKLNFAHGDEKAEDPLFGGVYNIIKDVCILINNTEPHYKKTGVNLYTDGFKRQGREHNKIDYSDLPDAFTQNIEYNFSGSETILGGVQVPDGVFGMDLRHTSQGNQTYNSVELVVNLGDIHAMFKTVNDTALESVTIEVYGLELFHDAASLKALAIDGKRYAELVLKEERRKVLDTAIADVFTLQAQGAQSNGIYLSDIEVVQLDEGGAPVPFTDENAVVKVKIAEFDFASYPVWMLRKLQNEKRVESVPPNMLIVPLVQGVTGLGGLSPAQMATGATLEIMGNEIDGQEGATMLNVLKTYSYKIA